MGPDPCCISPPCGGGGSGPVPRIHFPLPSWQKTDRHGHVFFLADRVSPQKLSLCTRRTGTSTSSSADPRPLQVYGKRGLPPLADPMVLPLPVPFTFLGGAQTCQLMPEGTRQEGWRRAQFQVPPQMQWCA